MTSRGYIIKGSVYLAIAACSPLLLKDIPVMAVIQTTILALFGGFLIYRGVAS